VLPFDRFSKKAIGVIWQGRPTKVSKGFRG
jgi:hypothetical protein